MKRTTTLAALLLLVADLCSAASPSKLENRTFEYQGTDEFVPVIGYHTAHHISFPCDEPAFTDLCIEAIGKRTDSGMNFGSGFCPTGSLFCYDCEYDSLTGTATIHLAQNPEFDRWPDALLAKWDIPEAVEGFCGPMIYDCDECYWAGYSVNRDADFLELAKKYRRN